MAVDGFGNGKGNEVGRSHCSDNERTRPLRPATVPRALSFLLLGLVSVLSRTGASRRSEQPPPSSARCPSEGAGFPDLLVSFPEFSMSLPYFSFSQSLSLYKDQIKQPRDNRTERLLRNYPEQDPQITNHLGRASSPTFVFATSWQMSLADGGPLPHCTVGVALELILLAVLERM